jgi:hypothetical protein
LTEGAFFGSSDDDEPSSSWRDPSDSHYEVTEPFDDELDGPPSELPPADSEDSGEFYQVADSPGVQEATSASAGPASSAPVAWSSKSLHNWRRFQLLAAISFGGLSLAVLGFFLVSALTAGRAINSEILAIVVGVIGTVAFLLLSIEATTLLAVVLELARHMQQIRAENGRMAGVIATDRWPSDNSPVHADDDSGWA